MVLLCQTIDLLFPLANSGVCQSTSDVEESHIRPTEREGVTPCQVYVVISDCEQNHSNRPTDCSQMNETDTGLSSFYCSLPPISGRKQVCSDKRETDTHDYHRSNSVHCCAVVISNTSDPQTELAGATDVRPVLGPHRTHAQPKSSPTTDDGESVEYTGYVAHIVCLN